MFCDRNILRLLPPRLGLRAPHRGSHPTQSCEELTPGPLQEPYKEAAELGSQEAGGAGLSGGFYKELWHTVYVKG